MNSKRALTGLAALRKTNDYKIAIGVPKTGVDVSRK